MSARFNPAPGWPVPPEGWTPPEGWEPDPSWPAPPEGWQFWVEDSLEGGAAASDSATTVMPAVPTAAGAPQGEVPPAAPGSVPPAQYATHEQWNNEPEGKKNNLLWIIPVALIVLIGLVFGALALAGVFGDDDDAPQATTRTATPTPSAEPTEPESPAAESPTPEPTTDPTTEAPADSPDPLAAAFCDGQMAVASDNLQAISAETAGEYVQHMGVVYETMQTMQAPAEIADAWAFNMEYTRDSLEYIGDLDPATGNQEAQAEFFTASGVTQEELMETASAMQSFLVANCS